MCSEYKLVLVGGEWQWMTVKNRISSAGEGDLVGGARDFVFHVFPDREAPIIRKDAEGDLEMVLARWGFDHWQEGGKPLTIAKSLTGRFWRKWMEPKWRCLVPVYEFCEPARHMPGKKAWFSMADGEPFYMVGVWKEYEGTRGLKSAPVTGKHTLYSILTCPPNGVVGPIHDRMPIIVTRAHAMEWFEATTEQVLAIETHGPPPHWCREEQMATPGQSKTPPR